MFSRPYSCWGQVRNFIIPYFLRREERSKEASTPSKASPYMGRMQLTTRENPLRQSFGMPRKACAPSGRGMIIISKMTFDGHFYLNVLCEGGSSHLSS